MASAAAAALALAGCAPVIDGAVAGLVSEPAGVVRARRGADPMPGDPQTLTTRRASAREGDDWRARRLAREMREGIAVYRDVERAVADGFRPFPANPPPELRIIHYTNGKRARREARRIDPRQPSSLLYERVPGGGLRLVGAMLTAPPDATLEELDWRVPLSVAQWHLHQNVCVPRPVWDANAWARRAADGRPLFGPGSPTTSEAACDRVGGRFLPTIFGWMTHVHVYAHDPADLWNPMYGHGGAHANGQGGAHVHH